MQKQYSGEAGVSGEPDENVSIASTDNVSNDVKEALTVIFFVF